MIALAILSSLALLSSRSIQSSLTNKRNIQARIDRESIVRDALAVMKRDIEKAFNFYDYHAELYNESFKERIIRCEKENKKKTTTPNTTNPNGQTPTTTNPTTTNNTNETKKDPCASLKEKFKEKKMVSNTQFLGEEDNLHFTSASNIRSFAESMESNLAEIGYFIDDCKSRKTGDSVNKCLWRRSSAFIDDKVDEDGNKMVLVENVDRFEMKYAGDIEGDKEELDWKKEWKTTDKQSKHSNGQFPNVVEITLGVVEKAQKANLKPKKFALTVVAPIRFPNNIAKVREEKRAEEAALKQQQEQQEQQQQQQNQNNTSQDTTNPEGSGG